MRILLIGPPDSGRRIFAKSLKRKYPELSITENPEDFLKSIFGKDENRTPALGLFSDYRGEILLASYRSCEMVKRDNRIYTHSILDSFVHTLTISALKMKNNSISDIWIESLKFYPSFIQDSLVYDLVISFEREPKDEIEFLFYENIKFVTNYFGLQTIDSKNKKKIYETIDAIKRRQDDNTNKREDQEKSD